MSGKTTQKELKCFSMNKVLRETVETTWYNQTDDGWCVTAKKLNMTMNMTECDHVSMWTSIHWHIKLPAGRQHTTTGLKTKEDLTIWDRIAFSVHRWKSQYLYCVNPIKWNYREKLRWETTTCTLSLCLTEVQFKKKKLVYWIQKHVLIRK